MHTKKKHARRATCAFAAVLCFALAVAEAEDCGPVPYPGAAGPYDYTNSSHMWNLTDITEHHWKPAKHYLAENDVQKALRDIHFILVRVPNYYPALFELGRIYQRNPTLVYDTSRQTEPIEFPPTPDCYFDRAFRYRPDDAVLRMLFAMYQHKTKRLQEALEQYRRAELMDPESIEIQYNLGLLYFDLKDFEASVSHAKRAYDGGYPLSGLREKLKAVGAWPDVDR